MRGLEIEHVPESGGIIAEFGKDEYVELYSDPNGLSSLVWSTEKNAHDLAHEALKLSGGMSDAGDFMVHFLPDKEAEYPKSSELLSTLRANIARVAFCRINLGETSIVWRKLDNSDSGIYTQQAAAIFQTGHHDDALRAIEHTGTETVRQVVSKLVPDLETRLRDRLT